MSRQGIQQSAIHYNYFRDYDPAIGRYAESDPIGLNGGINTYGYVGANPVARSDPDGRQIALPVPPIVVPLPPPGIPGLPGTPPPTFHVPEFPAPNPITLCSISPVLCAMAPIMNMVGQACNPNEPECNKMRERDESACVAIAGARYGARGKAVCMGSAAARFAECLRFGPNGVTTPLHGVDTPL